MAATYVTEAELESNLGISATLYASAVVEEVCQAAEDIVKSYLWFDKFAATFQKIDSNVATLYFDLPHSLYVGETVVVTNAGAHYNGSKTITEITTYTITYTVSASDQPKHAIQPPATVSATTHIDYATVPAVREASLMLAVDIWQARQAAGGQAASIDGFAPSPFRMGNTLIARIRGLLAPYLGPSSMVG